MNDASIEAILTAIHELVDGERRTGIVRDALNYLRQSGAKADQRAVASLIKQQMGKLAVPVHARAIAQQLPAFPVTYARIITLWSSTHPELRLSVEQRLLGRNLHGQGSEVPDDLTADQALALIDKVADEVMEERPQEDRADVRLMVFRGLYVWDEEPVVDIPEHKNGDAKAKAKPRAKPAAKKGRGKEEATHSDTTAGIPDALTESVFHLLLETLRELPATDPQWGLLESFVAEVSRLAGVKADEAAADEVRLAEEAAAANAAAEVLARRTNADQALAILLRDHAGDLAAFERGDADAWTLDACPDVQLDATSSQIEALRELLDSYNELDAQQPSQVAERRKHRKALSDLEEGIANHCDDLSRLLGARAGGGTDKSPDGGGGGEGSPAEVDLGGETLPTAKEAETPLATDRTDSTDVTARQADVVAEAPTPEPTVDAVSTIVEEVEPDQPEEAQHPRRW